MIKKNQSFIHSFFFFFWYSFVKEIKFISCGFYTFTPMIYMISCGFQPKLILSLIMTDKMTFFRLKNHFSHFSKIALRPTLKKYEYGNKVTFYIVAWSKTSLSQIRYQLENKWFFLPSDSNWSENLFVNSILLPTDSKYTRFLSYIKKILRQNSLVYWFSIKQTVYYQ